MRDLVKRFGPDEARVIREYTAAEEGGEVQRKSNSHRITAGQYALAL